MESKAASHNPGLVFVDDSLPGVTRRRGGKGWTYFDPAGQRINDRAEIAAKVVKEIADRLAIKRKRRGAVDRLFVKQGRHELSVGGGYYASDLLSGTYIATGSYTYHMTDETAVEFGGADYFLTGKLEGMSTRTSAGTSDYILYSFRLTDAHTSRIVWEDAAEIKKQGLEDAAYR